MSEFKVGDKVEWCGVEGEVTRICNRDLCPLEVAFTDTTSTFSLDGRYLDWHKEPSLKLIKQKTAYYKWRLWDEDGDIVEPDYLIDESGAYGTGTSSSLWQGAIKREKISEAVYKCEEQG